MTVLTKAEAARPDARSPRFQLHLTTSGHAGMLRAVDGRDREGDRDLIVHFAVCRAAGVALIGPPAEGALASIADPVLRQAILDEVAWASGAPPSIWS